MKLLPPNIFLFAYGTLLHHELAPPAIQALVRQLTRVDRGTIAGALYDLGEYPGAVRDDSGASVHGIVYALPDRELLEKFDDYEGIDRQHPVDNLFVRRRVMAALENGDRVRCWVYLYNQSLEGKVRIPSGIYLPKNKD